MADDLGWGDVGFNGHPHIRTPNLDRLARSGVVLGRFYSASAVCSPTRASALTGRHPYRQDIPTANSGHLRPEEITLAEILRANGYATGFFGKWHLGTLTTKIQDANRGRPGDSTHYSLPTKNGFDIYFATESKVPTFDPLLKPRDFDTSRGESLRYGWTPIQDRTRALSYGTRYWVGPETLAEGKLEGDDTRIIMDRALHFIEQSLRNGTPFFTVIWLHAPHLPVVADAAHRNLYQDHPHTRQLYYGTISALDAQVGRLTRTLRASAADQNTMLWFASDNGPERDTPGTAGPFRERKGSLYEGGVRVPAFLVWPGQVESGTATNVPAVTSDYLPTVLAALNLEMPDNRPLDGISLMDVIRGDQTARGKPIGFQFRRQMSWVTDRYKLISTDAGQSFHLYDLLEDKAEQEDLAELQPQRVEAMKRALLHWIASCRRSAEGADYRPAAAKPDEMTKRGGAISRRTLSDGSSQMRLGIEEEARQPRRPETKSSPSTPIRPTGQTGKGPGLHLTGESPA